MAHDDHQARHAHGSSRAGSDLGLSFILVVGIAGLLAWATAGRGDAPPPRATPEEPAIAEAEPQPNRLPPPAAHGVAAPAPAALGEGNPAPGESESAEAPPSEPAPEAPPPASAESIPAEVTSAAPSAAAAPAETASAAAGGEFDKLAALKALAASGAAAARCRQGGAPPGAVAVVVTFGNDGRVASSRVNSGAYVGTPTARCILEKIDQTTVPAFGGAPRSLGTRVQLY